MNRDIKPIVNIGNIVQLNCIVQTSYGISMVHLYPGCKYTVEDIEVNISLKTGKTKYSYLLTSGTLKGWVNETSIIQQNADIVA